MRYKGKIGFVIDELVSPGVYKQTPVEKTVVGDVIAYRGQWENREAQNGDVSLSSKLSIIATPGITDCLRSIRYAWYKGVAWCVTNIEEQPPRLILTLGGSYDGYTVEEDTEPS